MRRQEPLAVRRVRILLLLGQRNGRRPTGKTAGSPESFASLQANESRLPLNNDKALSLVNVQLSLISGEGGFEPHEPHHRSVT
jgi:hypothetical protein